MQNQLFNFANYLADEAAKISRKYFRNLATVESKENLTPVTIADREIELHLRQLIHDLYPEHGIIGEEFANDANSCEYCWVIDPIDGTVAFSTGKPTFTTLVALIKNNQPLLSVIDQPILNERFSAINGVAARLNNQIIATSSVTELKDVRLNATTPYMFVTDYERQTFEKVRRAVKLTSFGGDAYAFGLLASGNIDVIVEADLQYYDVAALVPIISAAGGIISDWQGNQLTKDFNGQCLACANSELHQQVLMLISSRVVTIMD